MAVFLSPGVFPREIDISVLPASTSATRPAFVGTAQKGKLNKPLFVSTSEQFIDTFGNPFLDSNLGFAALGYFEQGNEAFVMRVGVECEEGQPEELANICIDTSGANIEGFGRIPTFRGIDLGRIKLRAVTEEEPYEFHEDGVFRPSDDTPNAADYTDVDSPDSCGTTVADLDFVGGGLSDTYIGAIDDTFIVLITDSPPPSSGSVMDGAKYEIVRNSDGKVISSGTVDESGTPGTSEPIPVGDGDDDTGLICAIVITGACPIEQGDVFTFRAQPDNRTFEFEVQGSSPGSFTFADGASFTNNDDFVTAFNALIGAGPDYRAIDLGGAPQIVTETAGERIQLVDTDSWALEVGTQLFAFDIPRSHFLGTESEEFVITTANNRIKISVTSPSVKDDFNATIPTGTTVGASTIASAIHNAGLKLGDRFFEAFTLTVAEDDDRVVVATVEDHQFDQVKLEASFTNIKTLKFAEEIGVLFPYTVAYRGFFDPRVKLPASSSTSPSTPQSCEDDPSSADCLADSKYYENIVGWAVAKSPGTWINDFSWTIELDPQRPGRFTSRITDTAGIEHDRIDDVSFDQREERHIANIVNENSSLGGVNGNAWFNWEDRPAFLGSDPGDVVSFELRTPSTFSKRSFVWLRVADPILGPSNGIPEDPAFSSELDRAIIGNPSLSTGLFAFQNPEEIDINLLLVPGVSSGAVIGQGLQLCESRGDCLYIVDPPFGLRPQQVVEWHNGLLLSDLTQAINSSYGALYWSWLKVFDQFSGQNIFVPPSGHVAGVFARTAREAEVWFAPAGLRRGRLLTPLDIEFNTTLGERNLLYGGGNAVNPIVKFTQEGITVFGQRTLQRRASALDRVNVRMLLIFLKKALVRLLREFVFEPNDRITRAQVTAAVNPFLADVQARRGLTGFKTVCDETNNTPERIDRNELWVSVFLKPTRAAEFIVLNLVILRTEQSFSAEEVLAAGGVVTTSA